MTEPQDPLAYDPDAILADPRALPVHRMYAAINIGVRDRSEHWCKCVNCGKPYPIVETTADHEAWDNETVCSNNCYREYMQYLREEMRQ